MRQSGHRIFTYGEKKFNTLGKSGLIDYFRTKADPKLIQHRFLMKRGRKLSGAEVSSLVLELNKKYWEDEKEDIVPFVEVILGLSNEFNITNIEAFAMVCYMFKAAGGKENLTKREIGDISEKAIQEANTLRLENWNKFMSILKEVS